MKKQKYDFFFRSMYNDISRRFWPRAILDALGCMFSMANLSLTRYGDHTGLAYSNRGLTSDL